MKHGSDNIMGARKGVAVFDYSFFIGGVGLTGQLSQRCHIEKKK
jgi:hypothetical protein